MDRVLVFDIGSTRLKTLEVLDGSPHRYREYNFSGVDRLDIGIIDKVVDSVRDVYDIYIITGQRASIMGWDDDGNYSRIYTWRSDVDIRYRERYIDRDDYMLNLFIRPGSGALRIKYVQDMGFKYVGGVESYITWLLTGEYIVDYTYAYPYGLLDPYSLEYIEYIVGKLEIDVDRLPNLVDSYRDCIEGGIPILMIPDQSASLVGEGLYISKATLGTGAFVDVYTGGELIGDPERGVNPMLALILDDTPIYMAEAFIFDWGVSLDQYIMGYGVGYDSIDKIDVGYDSYRVYPPLLRSTYSPKAGGDIGGYTVRDITLSLVGSLGFIIKLVSSVKGFDTIYLGGGGARSRLIPKLLAESIDIDVVLRRDVVKSSLYGAYLYYLLRMGEDIRDILESYRPVEYRYSGSSRYSWILNIYMDALDRLDPH